VIASRCHGLVLDIGCGDRWAASLLPPDSTYVGLDYPTTVSKGYPGHPDVFGDAQKLPFRESCFDTVLMMDVLEHLPTPPQAISEACRALKPGGHLILQVPFLYPLHDEPHDFHRWTVYGLHQLCTTHGLKITSGIYQGQPCETAAALFAIAIAKGIVDLISSKKITMALAPLWVLIIPLANLMGWLLARVLPDSDMMPMSYRLTAIKPE
jgi:SAM-dependent methyltransferase